MIPEIGHFALILAFCLAVLQLILPLFNLRAALFRPSNISSLWIQTAYPLSIGQSFFISFSFLCLAYAFVQDDFSVSYVALHSNTHLPLFYKISAIWGGHEGSLLLWLFILSLWILTLGITSRKKTLNTSQSKLFFAIVLTVLTAITLGFLSLLLFSSNPFARFLPDYPIDGNDLNPLLQDFGLVVHPPLLYMGYVGFAIPFAFAIGIIILKLCDAKKQLVNAKIKSESEPEIHIPWAKWLRPWCLTAFSFLTLGIMLGSWWAYYELGWGGWWFWDPVENASFIPWLVALALIHMLMTTDKQTYFQSLSLLLCILVFTFSLLGTFLVRSDVLASVHSFASDPKRGILILIFLVVVVAAGLILYSIWAKKEVQTKNVTLKNLELFSRETLILISSWCLLVAALSVLLGTLYPLFYEMISKQKISVGFPYFNAVFIPLVLPVLLLTPLGPIMKWGTNAMMAIVQKFRWIALISVILALLFPAFIYKFFISIPNISTNNAIPTSVGNLLWVILGLTIGFWIFLGTIVSLITKVKKKGSIKGLSFGAWGMIFAHSGIAITVIGITLVSHYQIERLVRILPGQNLDVANYHVIFEKVESIEGANYIGYRGHFKISSITTPTSNQFQLYPEKRLYVIQGSALSETAIDPGFFRDIYIALGEKLPQGAWSARIYYKPFVRWIWLGAIMIAFGALLAAWGRRTFK